MDEGKYTVTVVVAAPGTPLLNEAPGTTSGPGHMFYVTSNERGEAQSYGFAPVLHGSINGPGGIARDDNENYNDPVYARTMEVSKSQYDKLNEFGANPEKFGFDTHYKDARNNCVDFAWAGLNHAGIERANHLDVALPGAPLAPNVRVPLPGHSEGKSAYRPAENVDDVKSIKDPVPGSHLNHEQVHPMPAHRSILQRVLSEQPRLDDPAHADYAMYRQAREGVHKIDAEHGRVPSVHSDNLAASLVVSARASGMNRIDQVLVGQNAERIFAVEGNPHSFLGLDQKLAHVETMQALNTPVAQSGTYWEQAMQQGRQVRAEALQQQELTQSQVVRGPDQSQGPVL